MPSKFILLVFHRIIVAEGSKCLGNRITTPKVKTSMFCPSRMSLTKENSNLLVHTYVNAISNKVFLLCE